MASPGAFLSFQSVESFYTQAGLYDGRPGDDTRPNHGFDWVDQSHPELGILFEAGYRYRLGDHPAALRIGGTHHTGRLDDFSSSSEPSQGDTRQAVPNFYAIHDLELLRTRQGKPVLGLFARGGLTPDPDRSMVAAYADGGVNWFGPIPGRPDDIGGVAVSYTRFGRDFQKSTGRLGHARDETTVELTYKAQITPWWSLQADVQVLFNPAARPETGNRQTATVLGLRARVSF